MGKDAEVPLVSDPAKDPKRMAAFTRKVAMMLNSLVRNGSIRRNQTAGIKGDTFTIPGATGGTVVNLANGTGLVASPSPITANGTLSIGNTGVAAGNYSFGNFTVNGQGQLTAASNGAEHNGTVTSVGSGTGLTGGPITTAGNLSLANTTVAPGAYTNLDATIDAQGRVTSAANGSGGSVPVNTKGDLFTFSTVADRLPVGNDAYILSADSSKPTGLDWIPAGGNGVGAINGWEHPFTKPTIAGVTRVNTTGFTDSDDTNGLFIYRSGALSATDNLTLAHLAIPAGNWNLDVRIQGLWGDDNFAHGGAHLYESTTGKITTFGCQGTTTSQRLCINQFTNTTTFSSQPKFSAMTQRPNWLRIHYDGTNFTFFWSMDGYSWVQYGGNIGKTAFFTTAVTHAGFFLSPFSSAIICGVKCMSLTCG